MSLCACGCGRVTSIAKRNRFERNQFKGKHLRFISGHNTRTDEHPMKGKRHTKETIKKMVRIKTGKKFSEETRFKMSGSNHFNWKGGISFEPYCAEFTKEFKNFIKDSDDNRCQNTLCSGKSDCLCVHHINYIKKDCELHNLITVCLSCNSRANFERDFWEEHYKQIKMVKEMNV